jgi:ribosomal protein S18 acetylase RimI-like enzyme
MTRAEISVRPARAEEFAALSPLLPRLADLDVPAQRNPEDLWRGDLALLRAWSTGGRDDLHVLVAELTEQRSSPAGLAMIRLAPEPLSGVPSAHLDVLAVAAAAERRGVGAALMAASEAVAREHGATCMTLHVIDSNHRARRLYERAGFAAEVVRYIKRF